MSKELFQKAIAELKKDSKERKFSQSVDIIVNLKDIDLKKPDQQVDFYTALPHKSAKLRKVCGLVGPELAEDAKAEFDKSYTQSEFETLDKKDIKKIADSYDYFVAQANIMPKVAATFGRIFGPRGKMPNPKAGCVVPPKANLKVVYEKLSHTVRFKNKGALIIQASIGTADMDDEKLAENAFYAFDQIIHHAPKEKNNIKDVYVKLTMSKSIKVL